MSEFKVGDRVQYNDGMIGTIGYLTKNGWYIVDIETGEAKGEWGSARADSLKFAPKRHTFGGVVFEETGECRHPVAGEWLISSFYEGHPLFCKFRDDYSDPQVILKPVAVEGTP